MGMRKLFALTSILLLLSLSGIRLRPLLNADSLPGHVMPSTRSQTSWPIAVLSTRMNYPLQAAHQRLVPNPGPKCHTPSVRKIRSGATGGAHLVDSGKDVTPKEAGQTQIEGARIGYAQGAESCVVRVE